MYKLRMLNKQIKNYAGGPTEEYLEKRKDF